MQHEFIFKLDIKNLLFLHEQIEEALKKKDPNDILNHMSILQKQKNNAKTNKDYDLISKQYDMLSVFSNLKCL